MFQWYIGRVVQTVCSAELWHWWKWGKIYNKENFEERFDRSLMAHRAVLSSTVALSLKLKMLFLSYTSQCSGYPISIDVEHLFCHREFCWTVLLQKAESRKP